MRRPGVFLLLLLLEACVVAARAQAPAFPSPDDRYKADLLLVVAHPDDDVVIGGYLARLSLDEHKRIAVVYCTNGDAGGNAVGSAAGLALGDERQIEARRALQFLGIESVWFLNGNDTPGQNPLRSLDRWGHGRMLDDLVRLVRITRPDVIVTWLPDQVVGENHGDHQASGVLATEAFDAAGDPTAFPGQISPSRDNLTEGLLPWQPKKLYFFTDAFEVFTPYWHDAEEVPAFRKNIGEGTGPQYELTPVSPSRHVSYAELTAEQQAFYATQEGYLGVDALKKHDLKPFEYPVHLIFGKSLVGGTVTGDVFEKISSESVAFVPAPGYEPQPQTGLNFEIGDPWRFYAIWWKAHKLESLARLIAEPEVAADFGQAVNIPLLVCNGTAQPADISISASLPAGWSGNPIPPIPVRAGECYPIATQVTAPSAKEAKWYQLSWTASAGARQIGRVAVRAYVGKTGGLPQ